nr:hypothetical protein [Tanacetum cinerariifolium]
MKRSIDYVSNTILHANKKPALGSSPTPRELRHAMRDRVHEEENTPREQCHTRRDKREREVEVESIKEVQSFRTTGSGVESKLTSKILKATPFSIQMAAILLGSQ